MSYKRACRGTIREIQPFVHASCDNKSRQRPSEITSNVGCGRTSTVLATRCFHRRRFRGTLLKMFQLVLENSASCTQQRTQPARPSHRNPCCARIPLQRTYHQQHIARLGWAQSPGLAERLRQKETVPIEPSRRPRQLIRSSSPNNQPRAHVASSPLCLTCT